MVLKRKTLDSFYKKHSAADLLDPPLDKLIRPFLPLTLEIDEVASWVQNKQHLIKVQRVNFADTSVLIVERDPGLRCQIHTYPLDKQEQVIRALDYVYHKTVVF
jgi:hypothetical protein